MQCYRLQCYFYYKDEKNMKSISNVGCHNYPSRVFLKAGLPSPHLGLDAVQASEPEDLPSPQLPLGVVDLLVLLVHVLLRQLVLLGELARPPEEAQPAVGYAGDHLEGRREKVNRLKEPTLAAGR